MDARSTFVPHVEAAKLMEPRQRALDDPARPAEATPMLSPALGQLRLDAAAVEDVAVGLRIIAAVALHEIGFSPGATWPPPHRRHRLDQGQEFRDVIPVGGGQPRCKRNPLRVSEKVMFRPRLTAIGRVRSSFFPPRSARMEELSAMARARFNRPRWRNSASRTACKRRQTPARCQRTSRRQQVLPDPHPFPSEASARVGRSVTRTESRLRRRGPGRGAAPSP